jgi:hypothetical protein
VKSPLAHVSCVAKQSRSSPLRAWIMGPTFVPTQPGAAVEEGVPCPRWRGSRTGLQGRPLPAAFAARPRPADAAYWRLREGCA